MMLDKNVFPREPYLNEAGGFSIQIEIAGAILCFVLSFKVSFKIVEEPRNVVV